MSRPERIIDYVARRYERLEVHVAALGWPVDVSRSGWDAEHADEHSLIGYVWLTALHPLDSRSPEPDLDQPVRFSLTEQWVGEHAGGIWAEEGNSLVRCHYQGTAGAHGVRYCYMPESPNPTHWHPPDALTDHRPHSHLAAHQATAYFERFVAKELLAQRLRLP